MKRLPRILALLLLSSLAWEEAHGHAPPPPLTALADITISGNTQQSGYRIKSSNPPALSTTYMSEDFEGGTLGSLVAECTVSCAGDGTDVDVITDSAICGGHGYGGSKCVEITLDTATESIETVHYTQVNPNENPALGANGVFIRWDQRVNSDLITNTQSNGQIKLHIARNTDAAGSWLTGGLGPEYPCGAPTGQFSWFVDINSQDIPNTADKSKNGGSCAKQEFIGGQWIRIQVQYKRDAAANLGCTSVWINHSPRILNFCHADNGWNTSTHRMRSYFCIATEQNSLAGTSTCYIDNVKIANGWIE